MAKTRIGTGTVFERREKKYMVSVNQFQQLLPALSPHMRQDQYGLHTICTVYFDTEDYAVIRHSLDKPAFKEKLRLRSYGVPGPDDTVFLELKKKLGGVTYKRRAPMTLREAEAYLDGGALPGKQNQILGEIGWFVQRYGPTPKVVLSYDRIALFGIEDPDLRITFDKDIRWRDYNLSLGKGDYGSPVIEKGNKLMEIKTLGALPCWLTKILSDAAVYPASFSKYGTVYQDHLLLGEETRHAG